MRFKRKFSFCYCGKHSITKEDSRRVWKALLLGVATIGAAFVSDTSSPASVQIAASVVATGLFLSAAFLLFGIPKRYPCFVEGGWKGFNRLVCWGLTLMDLLYLCAHIAWELGNHGGGMIFEGSGILASFCCVAALLFILLSRRNAFRRGRSRRG